MKWPWPGDSREDKAKRIALAYRALCEQIISGDIPQPGEALNRLDTHWSTLGAGWVQPTLQPLRLDDWLPEKDMADMFHVTPKMVYDWGRRRTEIHVITTQDGRIYRVGDIVEYARTRRIRSLGES